MSNIESLKGKQILITSYSYASFGGAELNAVELADQLVQFGVKPTFFSYDIDGPLKKYIEEKFTTTVLTDQVYNLSESEDEDDMGITKFNINNYDYIWVGGNTVPISILRQINTTKTLPKFIFIHMSSLIAFPLDAPLMPDFEESIASRILSIGETTTADNIHRILKNSTSVGYWRNPVPREFKNLKERSGDLRKIAVISSSHPSSEIMDIKRTIEQQDIEVDYIGRFNNNVKVVDAEFYDKYDLIIGIGKNARYSLVSGVPIYIYGRFGGGGYVNEHNSKLNGAYGFSGRGSGKKESDIIADEIVSGYQDALEFHSSHRKKFIKEFSLDNIVEKLFSDLERQKNNSVKFEEQYINWLVSLQINLMQGRQNAARLRSANSRVRKFKAESGKQKKEIRHIYGSLSWKITRPLRIVNGLRRKVKTKMLNR